MDEYSHSPLLQFSIIPRVKKPRSSYRNIYKLPWILVTANLLFSKKFAQNRGKIMIFCEFIKEWTGISRYCNHKAHSRMERALRMIQRVPRKEKSLGREATLYCVQSAHFPHICYDIPIHVIESGFLPGYLYLL